MSGEVFSKLGVALPGWCEESKSYLAAKVQLGLIKVGLVKRIQHVADHLSRLEGW